MKNEDIKKFFDFFIKSIKRINGKEFSRFNKDTALNYQIYYGDILISCRFLGAFYVKTNSILHIKLVNMDSIKILGDDNIEVNNNFDDIMNNVISYLKDKDLKVELA